MLLSREKKRTTVLLTLLLVLIYSVALPQKRMEPYDFPIKPGMEEWENLQSGEKRINACQIPNDVISSLDTQALIRTCLDYPLLPQIMAANNLQDGFQRLAAIFNGFQELLVRKNAPDKLLELYKKMNPSELDRSWSPNRLGSYTFNFTYIEIILAQDEILSKMTTTERKNLLKQALNKYERKLLISDIYSQYGLKTSAIIMGRILNVDDSEFKNMTKKQSLKSFVEKVEVSDISDLDLVYKRAKNF